MPRFTVQFDYEFPTQKGFLDGTLLAILAHAEETVHQAGAAGGAAPPARIDLEKVKIALREALANAAEHGNGFRPDRSIRVQGRADREKLSIEVEDEGPGFDHARTLRELARQGARRERGRGLRFMKGLADQVRFERGGSRVVLEFTREGRR